MEGSTAYRIFILVQSIFVLVAIVAFSKWRELSKGRKLRNLVSWSAIGDYCPALGCYSYVRELLFAVLKAQHIDSIDKKYRLAEDEKHWVIDILEEYQTDIMRSYFKGQLKLIKSKYAVDGKDYFMLMLYIFLSDHQCDYKFIEKDMHKETLEYKRYGDWGGPLYDATYELTGFAIVFHKMHYITYMYCRRSDILKSFVPAWNEENLKKILDTNQIQISRC